MLSQLTLDKSINNQLDSTDTPIQLFFDRQGRFSFFLRLPTNEDKQEGVASHVPTLSINELVEKGRHFHLSLFRPEFATQEKKFAKFGDSAVFLKKLANLAEISQLDEKAEAYLHKAFSLNSFDTHAKHRLTSFLIRSNRFKEASSIIDSEGFEEDSFAQLQKAHISIRQKDFLGAKSLVERALEIDPTSFEARLFAGTLSIYFHEWEESIHHYRIASDENPKVSNLYVNMAYSYWMLHRHDKAESSLKRAILLNPLNKNAIVFYSDIARRLEKPAESLAFLEFFAEFEQKDQDIWERIGLNSFQHFKLTGEKSYLRKALEAFKLQNSLESSIHVWNNLALVNWKLGDKSKAEKFFSEAITKAESTNELESGLLPIFNAALLILETSDFKKLNYFTGYFIDQLNSLPTDRNEIFEKIKLLHVLSVEKVMGLQAASVMAEHFLELGVQDDETRFDLQNRILIFYAETACDKDKTYSLISELDKVLSSNIQISALLKKRITNNIAFAYCMFEEKDKAQFYLNRLSHEFYKDSYSTATLGLYKLRKGQIDEGAELYKRALELVASSSERTKFTQRMNFELAMAYFQKGMTSESLRYAKKALAIKNGNIDLVPAISKLTEQLKYLPLTKHS